MIMIIKKILNDLKPAGLLMTALFVLALPGTAADVYLVAKEFIKTMPDATDITMWGYAVDIDSDLSTDDGEIPTVPGPEITVAHTDSTLNIHLRNDLSVLTSIVIPGQPGSLAPVSFTDGQGRDRVMSFTQTTLPSGGIHIYTWNSLEPGTYLYQSGTHVAVQVQMGLYGAMKKNESATHAYPGVPFDNEVCLLYSEIDPALHAAIDNGVYGTAVYPSPMSYRPKYFLVNGESFEFGQSPIAAGATGEALLVRCLNAGLQTVCPTFQYLRFFPKAEDGNAYLYPTRPQTTLRLPAGKTKDLIFVPTNAGIFPVYDRRLFLTANEVSGGGFLNYLEITAGP